MNADTNRADQGSPPWHILAVNDVANELQVNPRDGLSKNEVRRRAAVYGSNRLASQTPRPVWLRLLDQFMGFLILVLLFAAGLATIIGNYRDAIVILSVIILNATLGFVQEYRAEQSLAALKRMLALNARVRREGQRVEIIAEDIVPGDIVALEAGDRVPADGRLMVSHGLEVSEASLTGESLPVAKRVESLNDAKLPLADRVNMVWDEYRRH